MSSCETTFTAGPCNRRLGRPSGARDLVHDFSDLFFIVKSFIIRIRNRACETISNQLQDSFCGILRHLGSSRIALGFERKSMNPERRQNWRWSFNDLPRICRELLPQALISFKNAWFLKDEKDASEGYSFQYGPRALTTITRERCAAT